MNAIDNALLLKIGIALSSEKNADDLLCTILNAAMDITHCDGGTLYTLRDDALHFQILSTRSMGIFQSAHREPIGLPPVPLTRGNVCSCCALDSQLISIPDVYASEQFDFSGPQNYDRITHYRTQSMLVVPMENDKGEVIGVMQLINAMDDQDQVIPFGEMYSMAVLSLASQAAIRITNMNYAVEVEELLNSLVRTMSTAIDERTPYNANHTRNMALYAERFIDRLDSVCDTWSLADSKKQFLMAIWLHDIGKLIVPMEIIDKNSRLGMKINNVMYRMQLAQMSNRIALLESRISSADHASREKLIADVTTMVRSFNTASFVSEEMIEAIKGVRGVTYADMDGQEIPLLTEDEIIALCVQHGTLTAHERSIMESHAEMTRLMLDKMVFTGSYRDVPALAAAHHEKLDGSGYPNRLRGDSISREMRLLTILDIFEALTAMDRPYKSPMSVPKSLEILDEMVAAGQLDGEILSHFKKTKPWEA